MGLFDTNNFGQGNSDPFVAMSDQQLQQLISLPQDQFSNWQNSVAPQSPAYQDAYANDGLTGAGWHTPPSTWALPDGSVTSPASPGFNWGSLLGPQTLPSLAQLGGAYLNNNAAGKASSAQQQSAQQALALQRQQYQDALQRQQPFLQTGLAANARLSDLMGTSGNSGAAGYGSLTHNFSLSDLKADPVYNTGLQFGLDQGKGDINARAIQSGGYDSGATLKALTRYANDYGTTKAEGAYNRFNTNNTLQYNRLSDVSGGGQTATHDVNTLGSNYGTSGGGLMTDAGTARSAGIVGGANAWGSALRGISNNLTSQNNSQQLLQYLQQLQATRGY